jgi:hypothetical protein
VPIKDLAARKLYAQSQYLKNRDVFLARSKARRLKLQAEKVLLPKPERILPPCYICNLSREKTDFPARGNKCKVCVSVFNKQYRLENAKHIATTKKEWVNKNRDHKALQDKLWAENNREVSNAHKQRWNKNNAGAKTALDRKYRTSKINRTPSWLDAVDFAEIEFTYMWCAALRSCGLDYHVDHIIPLQGKTVSGLHVPWNLQVIPAVENIRKGNRCNYA